jgi:hypothetical protein
MYKTTKRNKNFLWWTSLSILFLVFIKFKTNLPNKNKKWKMSIAYPHPLRCFLKSKRTYTLASHAFANAFMAIIVCGVLYSRRDWTDTVRYVLYSVIIIPFSTSWIPFKGNTKSHTTGSRESKVYIICAVLTAFVGKLIFLGFSFFCSSIIFANTSIFSSNNLFRFCSSLTV